MSYFEAASFCSAGEYRAGKNTHLMPSELQVNELYMLMMAVEYQKHDRAVKWPSSVLEVQALRTGSHLIRFALLDEDLQHYSTGFAEFNAGFWVRNPDRPNLREMLIKEGIFILSIYGELTAKVFPSWPNKPSAIIKGAPVLI